MIWSLRLFFVAVIITMLGVTTWASLQQPLGAFARSSTIREPWVIATLADAYFAFVAVFVWMAWKERSLPARLLWFISVIALGNLTIAVYFLRELFSIPADGRLSDVFDRRNPGTTALPAFLTAVSVGVYLLA